MLSFSNISILFCCVKKDLKKIILASASPRRKELMKKIGLKFEIEPANSEEATGFVKDARRLVRKLSRDKAEAIALKHRNAIVIAADTVVLLEDNILGKPGSRAEAGRMLRSLSGKSHTVITGFTIIDTGKKQVLSKSVETKVYMRELEQKEISAYVKSGEPLDKAGAYAIQGLGSVFVERIEGDYFNVVGLPLCALSESLKEFGINVLSVQAEPTTE